MIDVVNITLTVNSDELYNNFKVEWRREGYPSHWIWTKKIYTTNLNSRKRHNLLFERKSIHEDIKKGFYSLFGNN